MPVQMLNSILCLLDDTAMTSRLELIATRMSPVCLRGCGSLRVTSSRSGKATMQFFQMHTCRSRMITPYKVYQRRITDNDDEIEFVAICEPSGKDREYPKIILPHLTFTHPNTVKLGKYCPIFSCKHAFGFSLEHSPQNCPEICAWLQSYLHGRFSNFFSLPSPSCV